MASKAHNGFTLIELLVSVAIIMAITGGVLVNYNSYNDSQKARAAALTVKNNLRYAQGRAQNGEKPASGCTQLVGYKTTFTQNTYTTQAQCTEGLAGTGTSVSLETGLSFSPVPPAILFRVLTRGPDADVTVKVAGPGKSFQFQVSKSGDIGEVTQAP